MNSNKPSTESLKNIKKHLENKLDESSDSTCESSDDNSNNKSLKYHNLETKLRYMQLEMVNKDIEISELNNKLNKFNTYELLITKINFLFDRLNNANNILIEKIVSININPLSVMIQHKELCNKAIEKYEKYFTDDLLPLFNNDQKYLKIAITKLYLSKKNELIVINDKIDDQIQITKTKNLINYSIIILLGQIGILGIVLIIFYSFK
jgi:hypothetical protein